MARWSLLILPLLLGGCVGNNSDSALTFAERSQFTFGENRLGEQCDIKSIAVPDGHETSTVGHASCSVWVEQPGVDDSVVTCLFALAHATSQEAMDPESSFQDFPAGERTWRFRRDKDGDFMAILPLAESAVAVYGSLGWSDEDVREFLARVDVR